MKAVGHPIRVQLVDWLRRGERCVCELQKLAGRDISNTSRHLAQLRRAGIVSARRVGGKTFCRLQTPPILAALDVALEIAKAEFRKHSRMMPSG